MTATPYSKRGLPILLLGLALLASQALAQASESDVVGRVIRVQGEAYLSDGRPVERGSGLTQGMAVHTGADSRVRIRFTGGSLFTLGANSALGVERYEPKTPETPQQARFRLLEGVMLALAEGIAPAAGEFVIQTTAGSIGIRGTVLWGGYFEPGQADFILFKDGPVDIANALGRVTLATPGQGTTIAVDTKNQARSAPQEPVYWQPDKVFKARTTVAFD